MIQETLSDRSICSIKFIPRTQIHATVVCALKYRSDLGNHAVESALIAQLKHDLAIPQLAEYKWTPGLMSARLHDGIFLPKRV